MPSTLRRLRAVPDVPRRGLGIVRVSKVGERGDGLISPELQRNAINDYAAGHGIAVVDWLEVLDESASQRRSPWWRKLDQAIERVESGEIDVIVGWKFSRAARNRLKWAVAIDRIEAAGGTLESATEQVDTTTATGRFTRGMLGEVAALQADMIGEGWKEVHAKRVRDGKPANGKPRWGYRTVDGSFVPDPELGPVLASLYRRYVAGESMFSLVEWLNRNGHRTSPGYARRGAGLWSHQTLRRMLDAGFGAGKLLVHGQHIHGQHQPVIDETSWSAYLAARAERRRARSSERSTYLLSGLVWCACGARMTGGMFGKKPGRPGRAHYRCTAGNGNAISRHPKTLARMDVIEARVLAWLEELRDDVQAATQAALLRQTRAARRRRDADTIAWEITALDAQLTKLLLQQSADRAAGAAVPEHVYTAARDEIGAQRAQLLEQLRAAEADSAQVRPPAELVARLLEEWDELSVEHRRGALRELIARITVTPGGRTEVTILPTWT